MGAGSARHPHPSTEAGRGSPGAAHQPRPCTLVWIDSRSAIIVRRHGETLRLTRLASDVPARHRSTAHVRHDPHVRHGGGGPATAGEPSRLEHLHRFVVQVADRLAPGDDLLILGPGTVRTRLERLLLMADAVAGRQRTITSEAAPVRTDAQLRARLLTLEGDEPRRRTVGTHRRRPATERLASGAIRCAPRHFGRRPAG